MLTNFDPTTSAVVWLMRQNGYKVEVVQDGETVRATATHPTEPPQNATGSDVYLTVCDLAERCGMELDDG